MRREEVLAKVEELMCTYCSGCFLKSQHKQDYGKRYAHRFCITQCTVGEKIRLCGTKLSVKGTKKN